MLCANIKSFPDKLFKRCCLFFSDRSFENVHMVVFCVMMVFIGQAVLLMQISESILSQWEVWESMVGQYVGRG